MKAFSLACILLETALATAGYAATRDGIAITDQGKQRSWPKLPVRICPTKNSPADLRRDVQKAADIWNSQFPSPVLDVKCVSPSEHYAPGDIKNRAIYLAKSEFKSTGDPLALARTLTEYDEDTGTISDVDVLLNTHAFDWAKLKADRVSVLVHEFGHIFGLQHLPISLSSVMNQYPYQSGIKRRSLGEYERKSILLKYFSGKEKLPAHIDLFLTGDLDGAITALNAIQQPTADDLYAIGIILRRQKKNEGALPIFERSLSLNPTSDLTLYQIADSHSSLGHSKLAVEYLQKTLTQNPQNYEATADLALFELKAGNVKGAVNRFKKALAINPVHYPACFFLWELTQEKTYQTCLKRFAPAELMAP